MLTVTRFFSKITGSRKNALIPIPIKVGNIIFVISFRLNFLFCNKIINEYIAMIGAKVRAMRLWQINKLDREKIKNNFFLFSFINRVKDQKIKGIILRASDSAIAPRT